MGKWKLAISRRETLLCERNLRCRKSSFGQSRESSLVLIRNFLQKWPRVEFHHFGPYSLGWFSTYGSSIAAKLEPAHNGIMEMAGIKFGAPPAFAAGMRKDGISCFGVIFSRSDLNEKRSHGIANCTNRLRLTSRRRGANRHCHSTCIAKVRSH